MKNSMRQHAESGQVVVLLAVAMIGLLAIVGLALDGGMLYWNQRRAQNGADAAAIAGTTALISQVLDESYACGTSIEQPIIAKINEYTFNNEVPNADTGQNVEAYYLTEDSAKNRIDVINPSTGEAWKVGDTGHIPCVNVVGLRVQASFPQDTFLAGVIGIVKTNVTVEASAIYEHRNWCTNFVLFSANRDRGKGVLSLTGAGTSVTGAGLHSNGGMQLGGGGQGIYLEPPYDVEYDTYGDTQINYSKISGGPDPSAADKGIGPVDSYPLPDDFFYRFEDFAPTNGFIWNEVDASQRFYFTGNIGNNDVRNTDGSLRDGLYVTEGSVHLNNLDNLGLYDPPWRVTIVAREEVQLSGGVNQLPIARGVFIYTLSDNTANGAVKLSGSDNKWAGLIVAPNGDANMSAANNSDLGGQIIASRIDVSGSNLNFNHRPEYCPPNPPRVLLVQ